MSRHDMTIDVTMIGPNNISLLGNEWQHETCGLSCCMPVLLQFMYDLSGVGKPMRQWMVVQLGTWHPYKQANTVVWSHWGPRVFAPLFNELVSNANFNRKARLSTIIRFFTIVRLAYDSFRDDLDDAVRKLKQNNTKPIATAILRDLKKLLVFYIPVVISLCFATCHVVILRHDTRVSSNVP